MSRAKFNFIYRDTGILEAVATMPLRGRTLRKGKADAAFERFFQLFERGFGEASDNMDFLREHVTRKTYRKLARYGAYRMRNQGPTNQIIESLVRCLALDEQADAKYHMSNIYGAEGHDNLYDTLLGCCLAVHSEGAVMQLFNSSSVFPKVTFPERLREAFRAAIRRLGFTKDLTLVLLRAIDRSIEWTQ